MFLQFYTPQMYITNYSVPKRKSYRFAAKYKKNKL
jgi:hypothetical protein